jgi:ribonuclease PH
MRAENRKYNQIRPISIELSPLINAQTSCLIKCGNTHIICSASYESKVPQFLRNTGSGWLSAEYSMLPCSTNERIRRDISQNKPNARSSEIQRLIGRSLRAALDLKKLGEMQIIIDCDVINADGGTRCASITGGYVALSMLIKSLMQRRVLKTDPIIKQIAAISCGIHNGNLLADLDYLEDSNAEVDANFILSSDDSIVELQACAEKQAFKADDFHKMLELAKKACAELFAAQNDVLS